MAAALNLLLTLQSEAKSQGFNPETIFTQFCNKTGQPIGKWGVQELEKLVKVIGYNRVITMIGLKEKEYISPLWYYTDGKALAALEIADAKGYFVYASGILFTMKFNQKVELYSKLDSFNEENIITWNGKLRQVLAVIKKITPKTNGTGSYAAPSNPHEIMIEIDKQIAVVKKIIMNKNLSSTKIKEIGRTALSEFVGNSAFRAQYRHINSNLFGDDDYLELEIGQMFADEQRLKVRQSVQIANAIIEKKKAHGGFLLNPAKFGRQ